MKKYLTTGLLLLPLLLASQHQPGKISFYIGGGYMSDAYLRHEVFHTIRAGTGSGKHNCVILSSGLGVQVSRKWKAGISVTFDHFGLEDRSVEYEMTSLMGTIQRIWMETRSVELSGSFSAGIKSWHLEENKLSTAHGKKAAFQFCPVILGIKADRFVFELKPGYGVSGLLQFGAWYRF